MSSILNPVSDTVRTNLATLLFFQDSTRPTKLVNESKQKPREVTMLRVCQYYGLLYCRWVQRLLCRVYPRLMPNRR